MLSIILHPFNITYKKAARLRFCNMQIYLNLNHSSVKRQTINQLRFFNQLTARQKSFMLLLKFSASRNRTEETSMGGEHKISLVLLLLVRNLLSQTLSQD